MTQASHPHSPPQQPQYEQDGWPVAPDGYKQQETAALRPLPRCANFLIVRSSFSTLAFSFSAQHVGEEEPGAAEVPLLQLVLRRLFEQAALHEKAFVRPLCQAPPGAYRQDAPYPEEAQYEEPLPCHG